MSCLMLLGSVSTGIYIPIYILVCVCICKLCTSWFLPFFGTGSFFVILIWVWAVYIIYFTCSFLNASKSGYNVWIHINKM